MHPLTRPHGPTSQASLTHILRFHATLLILFSRQTYVLSRGIDLILISIKRFETAVVPMQKIATVANPFNVQLKL